MAGTRKSNRMKVLNKKDGERNLTICPSGEQAAVTETRRTEWNKCLRFNAGVLLTNEEVRELAQAVCQIYPMKWIDTDKNEYLRRDTDHVFCSRRA